jgi:hypothetical protein
MLRDHLFFIGAVFLFPAMAQACATLPTIRAEEMRSLTTSANGGDVAAMERLGDAYEVGNFEDGKKDAREAFRWWQKAAQEGDAKAEDRLGEMYEEGQGVERNQRVANTWFRKAADQGDYFAQLHMWVVYNFGNSGEEKDPVQAYMWLLIANKNPERLKYDDSPPGKLPPLLIPMTSEQAAEAKRLADAWKPNPHRALKTRAVPNLPHRAPQSPAANGKPSGDVSAAPATDCKS